MAKFDIAAEKAKAATTNPVETGCYTARVTAVVDCNWVPGYKPGDAPKQSHGFVFQLATGQTVSKVFPNSASSKSHMGQLLACFEDLDDISQLAGKAITLDLEANGAWPKIVGIYPLESGMSDAVTAWPPADIIVLQPEAGADDVDPKAHQDTIKKLPVDIRKALLARPKLGAE